MQTSFAKTKTRFESKLLASAAVAEYFNGLVDDEKDAAELAAIDEASASFYEINDDYFYEAYTEEKYDYEDDYDPYGYSYDDDFYFNGRDVYDDYAYADNYYTARRAQIAEETAKSEGQSLGDILVSLQDRRRNLYNLDINV